MKFGREGGREGVREGVKARLMEEPVTQQQGGKNWELPGQQRRERQRQVRCTNVGRQGQSREHLFLVSLLASAGCSSLLPASSLGIKLFMYCKQEQTRELVSQGGRTATDFKAVV